MCKWQIWIHSHKTLRLSAIHVRNRTNDRELVAVLDQTEFAFQRLPTYEKYQRGFERCPLKGDILVVENSMKSGFPDQGPQAD